MAQLHSQQTMYYHVHLHLHPVQSEPSPAQSMPFSYITYYVYEILPLLTTNPSNALSTAQSLFSASWKTKLAGE